MLFPAWWNHSMPGFSQTCLKIFYSNSADLKGSD